MKSKNDFQTSAINRAARGMLNDMDNHGRASSMYSFKNRALHLSGEEIRNAWKNASSSIKKSRG